MRWRSKHEDRDRGDGVPSDEDAASDATDPGGLRAPPAPPGPGAQDRWADEFEARPEVPIDLGHIDPTELGRATRRAVARALAEDLGDRGDLTSLATVPVGRRGKAVIEARSAGVVAGIEVALHVFEQVDTRVEVQVAVDDGQRVEAGQVLATLTGPLASILTGERVALNFLGHLSGIATQVARFVEAAGPAVAVRDTRKTTPGLRLLEKAAVRAGGGHSHRIGLYDALLVKDNHIAAAGSVTAAVEAASSRGHGRHVQVEVATLGQLDDALAAGVSDILLDNFSVEELRDAVAHARGRAALEASGNIGLDDVADYAATGVDRIAVGRLTHSAPWLDVALDVVSTDEPEATRTGTEPTTAPLAQAEVDGDEPDADEPDADEPAADEPAADEPAADEPAAETAEQTETAEETDEAEVAEEVDEAEPTEATEESAVEAASDEDREPEDEDEPEDGGTETVAPIDSLFAWRDRSAEGERPDETA